jgi:hypothetical protein
MVITVTRPYFAPFPGYFYRAQLSDLIVILDQVQLPLRTTWITRNRFKNDRGVLWLTIPVWKKGRGLQSIDNVRICHEGRWRTKFSASLERAYADAPYFKEHSDFIDRVFSGKFERILDLNMEIIQYLFRCLGIDTPIVHQSELGVAESGNRLLLGICRRSNATAFLIPDYSLKHLDASLFERNGVELKPVSYQACVYPQLWGDFLSNLSVLDMIFNCGKKAQELMSGKSGGAVKSF